MSVKFVLLSLLSLLFIGCAQNENETQSTSDDIFVVPNTTVLKSTLTYDNKVSLWTLNDLPYSGYAISYYTDGAMKEKFGILQGRKQNKFMQWHLNGNLKNVTDYHMGKLHGEKKIWSADSQHVLIAHYQFDSGKAHGVQKKWYPDGKLFQKMNLSEGKEEGIQQAFRENGVLFANYEAKNGRIFGMKKANLCYQLEDEIVVKSE